jgi:hypothetical protein
VAVSITLGLLAAVVIAIALGRTGTADDPASVVVTGQAAATGPRSLPAAEVAGTVAVQLGLDRVQVNCRGDLVVEKGASVECLAPVGRHVWLQADVRVVDVLDGQPVLEFFDEAGAHISVLGDPLTDAERDWLRALRGLLLGWVEPLYFDAAAIDAATLRAWSADAARCTAELGPDGPPSPRLAAEVGPRASLACEELDAAAAAFESAAAKADSTDEVDVRTRAEQVVDGVGRWKYGNYILEEAWRYAERAAPGVGGV